MIENEAQPQAFSSIPQTMWWAVSALTTVGYGDVYPITVAGKILGSFIALLGIGLFALPAGIISSGFMQEINQQARLNIALHNARKITNAFYNTWISLNGYPTTHRVIDLITLKSRLELSEEDIFDAIQKDPSLRIRYKKNTKTERFYNTLVIEHYEFNRSYGCYINRGANITIISPMSYAEQSIGHFTSHLANYINADYLSNERYGEQHDPNVDYAFSFSTNEAYTNENIENVPQAFLDFKKDIKDVIQTNEIVFLIKSSNQQEEFNFHFGGKTGDNSFQIPNSTFRDLDVLADFYEKLAENYKEAGFDYRFVLHKYHNITLDYSIHQYIWKYTGVNVITIYINNDLIEWTDDVTYYKIIQVLGDTIHAYFGRKKKINLSEEAKK